MRVSISKGNSKMGNIPSVSLRPGADCTNCSKCLKSCYAMKAYRMYPAVRAAYERNSIIARNFIAQYAREVNEYIAKERPEYFRWHVSGDILGIGYLYMMFDIARDNPGTRFLCFTKRHDMCIGRECPPSNLTVVLSEWPGVEYPELNEGLPRAYMQDGTETRVPTGAVRCPGSCSTCKACWELKAGQAVVFNKH